MGQLQKLVEENEADNKMITCKELVVKMSVNFSVTREAKNSGARHSTSESKEQQPRIFIHNKLYIMSGKDIFRCGDSQNNLPSTIPFSGT